MKNLQSLGSLSNLGNPSGGAIGYLLYDQFITDVAAGSLNATTAAPTGQTRTVTDTNSKISVSSGLLTFATGEATNDGVRYPSLTRIPGRILLCQFTPGDNTGNNAFGWDTNNSGAGTDIFRMSGGGTGIIGIISNGTANVQVSTYAAATTYQLVVILRANGAFYFIKGGTYTNWTLLWHYNVESTSPMFPTAYSASTNAVSTFDNIRIPSAVWLPTPLSYDTFTRADGAIGSTESTGPDSQGVPILAWTGSTYTISTNAAVGTPATLGSNVIVNGAFAADTDWNKGANWTIAAGVATGATASSDLTATVAPLTAGVWYQTTYTITAFTSGTVQIKLGTTALPTHASAATFTETGRALTTAMVLTGAAFIGSIDNVSVKALTLSELFASISTSVKDIIAEVNITKTAALNGSQAGLVINLDSAATPANFVIAYLDGYGNACLHKCVAGTYTSVISAAVTYAAGATLRVIKDDTSYQLYYNNAKVGATATISDAGIVNNTLHGLFDTSSNNTLDNFLIMPRGTENQHGSLDRF